jgi:hypothetical protein
MTTNEAKTRVTILTGSYRIKGYIDLLPGARVTDFMHESKVYEAEVSGRQVLVAPFVDVNRSHIQIVTVC